MTGKAQSIVQSMSDVDAVRFLEYLGTEIFRATPRDTIVGGVAPELRNRAEFKRISSLDADARKNTLTPENSMRSARALLTAMANDETMAPLLVSAWESYHPDELFVEAVLTLGFVAAMLMCVASAEVDLKFKGVRIRKGPLSADAIAAITKPLFALLPGTHDVS